MNGLKRAEKSDDAQKKRTFSFGLLWLIISQLLTLASLVVWFPLAWMANLAQAESFTPSALWAYPLFPLLCIFHAWLCFAHQKQRAAAVLSALPLLPPLVVLILVALNYSIH